MGGPMKVGKLKEDDNNNCSICTYHKAIVTAYELQDQGYILNRDVKTMRAVGLTQLRIQLVVGVKAAGV
jgi:hypothetical protein